MTSTGPSSSRRSPLSVDRKSVIAFRARASHLDRRLPAGSFVAAAHGGLQDSAPRAAVLSLHARVHEVAPTAWEDESLCQIWGPRGADYVIPRGDLGVFALGRLPRDAEAAAILDRIADQVHGFCGGGARRTREVSEALPELGHAIRGAAVTGRLLIRWDASSIWVIPIEPPDVDPEQARLELARRFLGWFAPATLERFAWWSGVEDTDARATWAGLSAELIEVELDGEHRFMLRDQEETMVGGEPVSGVRLLPHGDPYIKTDGPLVVPDAARRPEVFPQPKVRTSFWPVSGAVVSEGEVIGSWARQQRRVTVHPWVELDERLRDAIGQEALSFPIAGRSPGQVRWVS